MIGSLRVLAVIPARAGSKRVPAKNIRDFRGKPLVQWTLECAKQSRYLDVIACSTDCPTVALIAWQQGAIVVPRPPELATDTAKSEDVMRQVLGLIPADIVVLLQPTSPLRIAEDIDTCVAAMTHRHFQINADYVVTVRPDGKRNGAVYVMDGCSIGRGRNFDKEGLVVTMPAERSLDIDEPEDFTDSPDALPGYIS